MAASLILTTTERTSLATKLNDDLDGGSLTIRTASGGGGTLIATFTLPAKASNTVANGVLTFGTISSVTASGTGTAAYAQLLNSAGTALMDVNVATSAASVIVDNTSINSGQSVSISSASLTVPAGT